MMDPQPPISAETPEPVVLPYAPPRRGPRALDYWLTFAGGLVVACAHVALAASLGLTLGVWIACVPAVLFVGLSVLTLLGRRDGQFLLGRVVIVFVGIAVGLSTLAAMVAVSPLLLVLGALYGVILRNYWCGLRLAQRRRQEGAAPSDAIIFL